MTAKTPAQRKAAERKRLRELGKWPLTIWAKKDQHAAIKGYARSLDNKTTPSHGKNSQ